jgi:imidazole glycerol-phosphate synthase subunit HisH
VRVTLFDYGAGNLHSLAKAVALAGGAARIEADPRRALDTDVLVLPGVGAFAPAAARLAPARTAMREALAGGLPCLGICLGLQLLFDASEEGGGAGLGLVPGRVTRLRARRLPQIGWGQIENAGDPAVAAAGLDWGYYANSFVGRPDDPSAVTAWSEYEGDRFPAAVRAARTLGIQSHPEKSSAPGVALIRAFLREVAA